MKPENILYFDKSTSLSPITGKWKISDFGQSKVLESEQKNTPYCVATYYRAPELILGSKHYNSKIDIWAFACIFHELLTLQPLFNGKTDALQLLEHLAILGRPGEFEFEQVCQSLQGTGRKIWMESCKKMEGVNFFFEQYFDRVMLYQQKGQAFDFTQECFDVLRACLRFSIEERASAEELLDMDFFKLRIPG